MTGHLLTALCERKTNKVLYNATNNVGDKIILWTKVIWSNESKTEFSGRNVKSMLSFGSNSYTGQNWWGGEWNKVQSKKKEKKRS